MLGAGGVGKSSLTIRMVEDQWIPEYDPTIEDYYTCNIDIDGSEITLDILDTAGMDQFPHFQHYWITHSNQFLLVYDIQSERSFKHAMEIYKKIRRTKESIHTPVVLVGNKADLYDDMYDIDRMRLSDDKYSMLVFGYVNRFETEYNINVPVEIKNICGCYIDKDTSIEVTYKQGEQLAESWGVPFFETSAKTGKNVKQAFRDLVVP